MAKKLSPPPEIAPLQLEGSLHPEWRQYFEQFLTNALIDADKDTLVQVEKNTDEDIIRFDTGGTERATLDSTGLDLKVLLDLTSGQIAFPATAVPSADANTMDDYEVGTWTIGIAFGGGTTGITYTLQAGRYIKIGKMVTLTGNIGLSNKGSSVGTAHITGLPFTCLDDDGGYTTANLRFSNITFANQYQAFVVKNTTTIRLEEATEDGAPITTLTNANFANDSGIVIQAVYETA